jgi:hypothetical protein
MSTFKKLKTYSKVQKEINYSTIFSNLAAPTYNNPTPPVKRKHKLNDSESIVETINLNKQALATAKTTASTRGRGRKKAIAEVNKENDIMNQANKNDDQQDLVGKQAVKRKKTKADQLKEQEQFKQIKLFEDSDSNSNGNTEQVDIVETKKSSNEFSLCDNISILNNNQKNSVSRRLKSTKINESSFKTANDRSTSPSATAIVNSAISSIDAYSFAQNNDVHIKSIIKQPTVSDVNNKKKQELEDIAKQQPDTNQAKSQRPKRLVRILEEINLKNDQLTNVKADNKHKHTAATSTPTGLRRRPLKVPQNVSIISKS